MRKFILFFSFALFFLLIGSVGYASDSSEHLSEPYNYLNIPSIEECPYVACEKTYIDYALNANDVSSSGIRSALDAKP